jgi:hypothetical protein
MPDPTGIAAEINLYVYVEDNPINCFDFKGLTKGGKKRISGEHSLVKGVGKKSSKQEINEAIKRVTEALKNPSLLSKEEKRFLKAWLKVAKRGFKLGGMLGILTDLFFTDELNAAEEELLLRIEGFLDIESDYNEECIP